MASERVDADILRPLAHRGKLSSKKYISALEIFRDGLWWDRWALRTLFALAIGHILAGIIFFFAHNWFGLSDSLKFGLVGGGIGLSVFLWIVLGLDSLAGKSFGIAATVLVGVTFAVFGQVYQTPALLHTPFVLWALMTLPFAAVSRNLAHWAVWIVIALVAMFAYAETGFYIAGHPLAADMLILVSALLAIFSVIGIDQFIRPRYPWTRGAWFRIFLISITAGLLVTAFTSTFWPWRAAELKALSYGLSLMAFLGALGVGLYLYKVRSTLAELSITTFAMTIIVVQIVIKLFQDSGWHSGVILLVFLIFTGLTVLLGALFKHYMRLTHDVVSAPIDEGEAPREVSLPRASEILSISETELSSLQQDIESKENPWYIETFLALAGMVTAGFGLAFFGLIFSSVLDFDNFGLALLIAGVPLYIGALILRNKSNQGYLRHLLNTFLMVGAAMIVGGIGLSLEENSSFNWGVPVSAVLLLVVLNITFVRDVIIEFLSALIALGTLYFYLGYELEMAYFEIILVALATALAMIFLTHVLKKRLLTAAASALLIYPVFASMSFGFGGVFGIESPIESLEWTRYAYSFAGVLIAAAAIVYLNVTNSAFKAWRPPIFVLIPLFIVMGLFPFGGASALLLILTGYVLGNRTLAILGILLEIYYLYMFYYELSISLGTKSYILMVVGLVFLAIWYVVNRHHAQEALA
ncbi:DUF4401 domain-containing protein [Litorimonas sp.]|uniref:DUF4401 domain-containing protein n=1 Tax=Litorimonas sp. TaxID=1892381 RepID=UPI003A8B3057